MNSKLKLDRPARRRLQNLDRRCSDADSRIRIRVVLKVASGLSRNAAAREVGCCRRPPSDTLLLDCP